MVMLGSLGKDCAIKDAYEAYNEYVGSGEVAGYSKTMSDSLVLSKSDLRNFTRLFMVACEEYGIFEVDENDVYHFNYDGTDISKENIYNTFIDFVRENISDNEEQLLFCRYCTSIVDRDTNSSSIEQEVLIDLL